MTGMNFPGLEDSINVAADEAVDNPGKKLFDPTGLANIVQQNTSRITKSAADLSTLGSIVGKDAVPLFEQATAAKANFQTAIDAILKQVDDTSAIITDASQKARQARYVPEAISMIASIFGINDFDPKYQNMRVEEALKQLNLSSTRVNAIGQIATIKEQQAQQALTGKKLELDAAATSAGATESSARTLIALQNAKDQQDLFALEKLTDAQIKKAMSDPAYAAKIVPGVDKGLIEKNMKQRAQLNTSIATANMTLQHMKDTYPDLVEQTKLRTQDQRESLEHNRVMRPITEEVAKVQLAHTKKMNPIAYEVAEMNRDQLKLMNPIQHKEALIRLEELVDQQKQNQQLRPEQLKQTVLQTWQAENQKRIAQHTTDKQLEQFDLEHQLKKAQVPAQIREIMLKQVTTIIENLPEVQRRALLKEAQQPENKGIAKLDLGGGQTVNVSDSMIQQAISKRTAQMVDEATKSSKVTEAQIEVTAFLQGAKDLVERLPQFTDIASPSELKSISSKVGAIATVTSDHYQNNNPSSILAAQKAAKDVEAEIAKLTDRVKKEMPLQQFAAKSFLYSGMVDDATAASAFMSDRFKVKMNALAPDSIFYQAGEAMNDYSKFVASQNKLLPSGIADKGKEASAFASLAELTRKPPKELEMFEEWLQKPSGQQFEGRDLTNEQKIQGTIKAKVRMQILNAAIMDLAQVRPDGGAIPEFSKVVVDGKLLPQYIANPKNFMRDLAAADIVNGGKAVETLVGKLRDPEFQKRVAQDYFRNLNTIEAAAISKRFMNNDPFQLIRAIMTDVLGAKDLAKQEQNAVKNGIHSGTAPILGLGMPAPAYGVEQFRNAATTNPIAQGSDQNPMIKADELMQKILNNQIGPQ